MAFLVRQLCLEIDRPFHVAFIDLEVSTATIWPSRPANASTRDGEAEGSHRT